MELAEILRLDYPVSDETIEDILKVSEIRVVPKNTSVVTQGERCYFMVFILDRLARLGFVENGKEETWAFGTTGDPFLAVETLMRNEPSRYTMSTLTRSKLLLIPFSALRRLTAKHTDFLHWQHHVLLEQVYYFANRQEFIRSGDALERYTRFMQLRQDEQASKIPLKYVAQYLKMAPETISRLRKRLETEAADKDEKQQP